LAKEEMLEIPVQLNGKKIDVVWVAADADEEATMQMVFKSVKVLAKLEGRQVVKKIYVPKRLVNLVAK
jgi:leucyl-tRNA synthetase